MASNFDIFYLFLLIAFAFGLGMYLKSVLPPLRKQEKSSDRRSRSKSSGRSHRSSRGSRHRGKRCPECRHIIDRRRTVCHHCGHEFKVDSDHEPHPDEEKENKAGSENGKGNKTVEEQNGGR
ncbi:MAG: hypothetical protein R6V10_14315 [bacterium]